MYWIKFRGGVFRVEFCWLCDCGWVLVVVGCVGVIKLFGLIVKVIISRVSSRLRFLWFFMFLFYFLVLKVSCLNFLNN